MVARLTATKLTDQEVDFGFYESWESYCGFWAVLLSFAVAKNADAIYYRLSETDECLGIEFGDQRFTMEPPPLEYRPELLDAIRRLTYRNKLRLAMLRLVGKFSQATFVGRIVLETELGDVEWSANVFPNRIKLERVRS